MFSKVTQIASPDRITFSFERVRCSLESVVVFFSERATSRPGSGWCYCKLFVDRGVLELLLSCVNKWHDHKEKLYHSMLPLASHDSNVKLLRVYLKCDQILTIFLDMLDNWDGESNDISYCTAGMLSFLLAGGEDLWHQKGGCDNAPP